MPKLVCPRCAIRIRAAEAMLAKSIVCPVCGAGLWQPASSLTPPPIQPPPVQPYPPTAPPRVVFLEADEARSPVLIVAAIAAGVLVFAGLVAVALKGNGLNTEQPLAKYPVAMPTVTSHPAFPQDSEPKRGSATIRPQPAATSAVDKLIARLESHGIKFNVTERMQAGHPGVWLTADNGSERVLIVEYDSHASALFASTAPPATGETQFVCQQFVVTGRRSPLLDQVRGVLAP